MSELQRGTSDSFDQIDPEIDDWEFGKDARGGGSSSITWGKGRQPDDQVVQRAENQPVLLEPRFVLLEYKHRLPGSDR